MFMVELYFLIPIYSHTNLHKLKALLTLQKVIETEHIDLALPFHRVGLTLLGHSRPRPEHFALAQTHSIDVLALDLQDEATVHHI